MISAQEITPGQNLSTSDSAWSEWDRSRSNPKLEIWVDMNRIPTGVPISIAKWIFGRVLFVSK